MPIPSLLPFLNSPIYLSPSGTGCIVGSVKFVNSEKIVDNWNLLRNEHRIDASEPLYGINTFGWKFKDPIHVDPIPYLIRRGSIIWRKYRSLCVYVKV